MSPAHELSQLGFVALCNAATTIIFFIFENRPGLDVWNPRLVEFSTYVENFLEGHIFMWEV